MEVGRSLKSNQTLVSNCVHREVTLQQRLACSLCSPWGFALVLTFLSLLLVVGKDTTISAKFNRKEAKAYNLEEQEGRERQT